MSHSVLRVVDQGEAAFLTAITAVGYTLRLFKTDVEAGLTTGQLEALTEADFTEATFAGYSAAALTGGSWTVTDTDPSFATYAQQTFTRSSTGTAQLIWGYYLTRTSDGELHWYEQFDGPISVEFINDAVRVTPRISLEDTEVIPVGTITAFGGSSVASGWLACNGQAVSRTTFAALFAIIGTAYGVGDGSTTFNVPDLRQRFPLGQAASGTGATLGGTGGTIDHTHGLDTATSHAKIGVSSAGGGVFNRRKTVTSYTDTQTGGSFGADTANARTTGAELGGSSGTANPPFQVVNYRIKT